MAHPVSSVNADGTKITSAPALANCAYSAGKRTSKQMDRPARTGGDVAAVKQLSAVPAVVCALSVCGP